MAQRDDRGRYADPDRPQPDRRPDEGRRGRDSDLQLGPGQDGEYGRNYGGWYGRGMGRTESMPEERPPGHRGRGPKGYRRSDERIREDVGDRLTDDPWIDASDIEIEVRDGEVTLRGTVDNRTTRRRAEDLAESISGVRYVQNNLRVRPHAQAGEPPIYEGTTSSSALAGQDAGIGSAGVGARSGAPAGSPAMGTMGGRSGAAPGVTSTTGAGYSNMTGTNRTGGSDGAAGRTGDGEGRHG